MTPEQLKISILKYAFMGTMCYSEFSIEEWEDTESKLYKYMWEVTVWDKKFKEVDRYKQTKVISYTYVLAGEFPKLEEEDGDVLLLSTGNYIGYTTEEKAKGLISEGEVVTLPWGGGPTLKYYKGKFVTADNRIATSLDTDMFDNKYLYYYMQSQVDFLASIYRGTGLKHPKMSAILDMRIPVPSLAEQHRIVAKIEELLPFVDRYEASYEKLEQFNAKFPEDMKKSILHYAIQGKLVEQKSEEGTAEELYKQIQDEKAKLIKEGKIKKEKPLDDITDDEIPFEIPNSWKWCRLSQIIDVRDGTHDSPKYVPEGIPLVTSKNLSNGTIDYSNVKYITQEDADKINERSSVDDNDILFAMIGSIGNPVLVKKDREFCIKNMALFKKYEGTNIDMKYMFWFFIYAQYALKAEASGGVQSFISLGRFREYLIPLPPYEEQGRIACQIEKILPYCDRLIK